MNAPAPRIVVTINVDGTVDARTEEIHGEACVDRIAILETLLDAITIDSKFTDDYRLMAGVQVDQAIEVEEQALEGEM